MNASQVHRFSPSLLIWSAIAILLAVGLASIYVTDTHYAAGHDGPINAAKQLVFIVAGLIVTAMVFRVGYMTVARQALLIFVASLLFLMPLIAARLTDASFGGLITPRNGAYRWIRFPGFQVQPSEFLKIALVLMLARYLRHGGQIRTFRGLLVPVGISVPPLLLILLEPDLGTVLLLLPVLLMMLLMAGARPAHLAVLLLAALAAAPLAWSQIRGYQRARVAAVLLQSSALREAIIQNPERYPMLATKRQAVEWAAGSGYQLVQSKTALGSGGLFGHGWGEGIYARTDLLPDRHNDFIFAIIGHQWGFVGCVIVLACYAIILIVGGRITSAAAEPVGRLLALGLVTMIATQALINVGMTVGLLPITGITLPFVSYGGSSLLTNFLSVALLIDVSRHRPFLLANDPFELQGMPALKTPLATRVDLPPQFTGRRADAPPTQSEVSDHRVSGAAR